MKIVKANKVLTSEALNAEMLINEDIRKNSESIRQVNETTRQTTTLNAEVATENANIAADRANLAAQNAEDIVAGTGMVMKTDKGIPNGVASLDGNGKVPIAQLPTIASSAEEIAYDNATSGLIATDSQSAIDELGLKIGNISSDVSNNKLVINVKDFGAVGDGITNDTTAIQSAINAATDGSTIEFPMGTYVVLSLNIHKSLKFHSYDIASIKLINNANTISTRVIMLKIITNGIDISFDGLVFDGNKDNQQYPDATHLYWYRVIEWILPTNTAVSGKKSRMTIKNCKFINTPSVAISCSGYNTTELSTTNNLIILDCQNNYFEKGFENDAGYLDTVLVSVGGNCSAIINNNIFDKNEEISLYGLSAITISTGNTSIEVLSTVTITNNTFINYGRQTTTGLGGIGVIDFYASCKNLIISNNKFINSFHTSIRGKTNSKCVIISDNIIDGYIITPKTEVFSYGIGVMRGTYFNIYDEYIIKSNILKNIIGSGISLAGSSYGFTPSGKAKDVIVANNTISLLKDVTNTVYGVYLSNLENAIIEGNVIKNANIGIAIADYKKEFTITNNQIYGAKDLFISMQSYVTDEPDYINYDANAIICGNTMRTTTNADNTSFRCIYVEKLNNVIVSGNMIKIEGTVAPQNFLRAGGFVQGLVNVNNNILDGVSPASYFTFITGTLIQNNNYNNKVLVP